MRVRSYIAGLFILMGSLFFKGVHAQNVFSSEEELIKQADTYFQSKDFIAAYPLYSQLLSIYPKDPNYNFRLGVCMLYSTGDKEKPIKFLELASKSSETDKMVYYYLGKAYHLNYRFGDALRLYNQFEEEASKSQLKEVDVAQDRRACVNGRTLLRNIQDLSVIENKEVGSEEFYLSYDMNLIGGKILVKPEDFQSAYDKKVGEKSIIFLANNNKQIFYSSYGKDGKKGRDIYAMYKLFNGEWSEPEPLSDVINTSSDEDFPFIHPNGKVLYFCSKGHNSMGGYDIFKSVLDERTNQWQKPQNLDFAINTPADDYMYVTDESEELAYFASNRTSADGNVNIYKIKADRKEMNVSIAMGTFKNTIDEGKNNASITVKNVATNEVVGIVNSDVISGEYRIDLKNGQQYMFTVEAEGVKTQSEIVFVPEERSSTAFNQEISYDASSQKLVVKSYFDEADADTSQVIAASFLRKKAMMEVNASADDEEEVIEEEETLPEDTAAIAAVEPEEEEQAPISEMSNEQIVAMAQQDTEELEEKAQELKDEANMLYSIIEKKNRLADLKQEEADQILEGTSDMVDGPAKTQEVNRANQLKSEADKLRKETIVAHNLAKRVESDAIAKDEEAALSKQYAKELEEAISSGNYEQALTKLDAQQKRLEELSNQPTQKDDATNKIAVEAQAKQKTADDAFAYSDELKSDIEGLKEEVARVRQEAEATKKQQMKDALLNQADDLEDERKFKEQELADNNLKAQKLQEEADVLKEQASLVSSLIQEVETSDETVVVSQAERQALDQQVKEIQEETGDEGDVLAMNDTPPSTTGGDEIDYSTPTEEQAAPQEEVVTPEEQPAVAEEESTPEEQQPTVPETSPEVVQEEQTQTTTETSLPEAITMDEGLDQAKGLEEEASEYKTLAEQIRSEAYTKESSAEREMMLEEANDVEALSHEKENEASAIYAKANAAEYITKEDQLKTYLEYEKQKEDQPDELIMVDLMNDEAKTYFDKAQEYRDEALAANNERDRKAASDKAFDFEKQAIEKQNKAIELYQKVNPEYASLDAGEQERQEEQMLTAETTARPEEEGVAVTTPTPEETTLAQQEETSEEEPAPVKYGMDPGEEEVVVMNTEEETSTEEQAIDETPAVEESTPTEVAAVETPEEQPATNADPAEVYQQSKADYEGALKNADALSEMLAKLNKMADSLQLLSYEMMAKSDEIEDEIERQEVMRKAQEYEAQSNAYLAKADSVYGTEEQLRTFAAAKKQELDSLDEVITAQQIAAAEAPEEQPTATQPESRLVESNSMPRSLNEVRAAKEGFSIAATTPYSDDNPIPIDPVLPEGLVFKVQVGAFRNPIPQDLFKGVQPIVGESTPAGFIRYTAGLFKDLEPAKAAKRQVQGMGYSDAFVVAFYNGKRITIAEALAMLGQDASSVASNETGGNAGTSAANQNTTADKSNKINNTNSGTTGTSSQGEQQSTGGDVAFNNTANQGSNTSNAAAGTRPSSGGNTSGGTTRPASSGGSAAPAKSQEVKSIQGLWYTVQVGVYSSPKSNAQLYNLNPLFSEQNTNGTIRYNCGIYNDVEKASQAADMIRNIGVRDAFVVAYKDGQRVGVQEAKQLETADGFVQFTDHPQINVLPSQNGEGDSFSFVAIGNEQNAAPTANANRPAETATTNRTGKVSFKVQVGAYSQDVPVDVANQLIQQSSYGIEVYKNDAGLTIYSIGDFDNYEAASKLRNEVAANGLSDSFVVAYLNENKISIDEANRIVSQR